MVKSVVNGLMAITIGIDFIQLDAVHTVLQNTARFTCKTKKLHVLFSPLFEPCP